MELLPRCTAAATAAVARSRLHLTRHRTPGRIIAVGAIALGAGTGWAALDALAAERDAWGQTVPVAVAIAPLTPGDHADASTVAVESWPEALAPDGALGVVPDAVVRQHVGAGEPLGSADVGPGPGPAGLVPSGWAAAAVPLDEARRPPLAVGDRLGVVIGGQRAGEGIVVAVDAATIVVAVPDEQAAVVAAAALDDAVSLVLDPN